MHNINLINLLREKRIDFLLWRGQKKYIYEIMSPNPHKKKLKPKRKQQLYQHRPPTNTHDLQPK